MKRSETALIQQCLRLARPATHRQRGDIGARRGSRPLPAAILDEVLDAPSAQEVGLQLDRGRHGQLVEADLGGDVLPARVGEVVLAATLVSVRA